MNDSIEGPRPAASPLDEVPRVDRVTPDPEKRRESGRERGVPRRGDRKPVPADPASGTSKPVASDPCREADPAGPADPEKGRHVDVKV